MRRPGNDPGREGSERSDPTSSGRRAAATNHYPQQGPKTVTLNTLVLFT